MRRTIAILGAVVLGIAAIPPAATAAPAKTDPGMSASDRASLAAGLPVAPKAPPGTAPKGPNPYLALLPDPSKADYSGWNAWLAQQASAWAQQRSKINSLAVSSPLVVDEDEPPGTRGANENPAIAQRITGFGTAAGRNPKLRILGALSPESASPVAVAPNAEDDGAIQLAGETGIGLSRSGITTSAQIGDGPNAASGDFDFYKFQARAGDVVTVDIDTPTGLLDSVVVLYDATGRVVGSNDDSPGDLDSLLKITVGSAGTYYVAVAGYGNLPADPTNPASGDGAGSTGPYNVTISAVADDHDFYAVKLRKGDVLGASVKGVATRIGVYDTVPRLVHGSSQDATYIYPASSPLPGGGNAVTDYVAQAAGWHYLDVGGSAGNYDITVEAYRAPLEGQKPTQTLFLDFDGARVNTNVWGGPGVRQLSPFSAFIAKWGLTREQEDDLIDRITDRVYENLVDDLEWSGLNDRFKLKVTNSRDNPDTFGKPNVSRIIVGGTIAESGISTIGISQSIDPGNFATSESALVLLDVLSDSGGTASLNTYITPASDKVAFIGDALGNVIAHEGGHFFGDWHVDQFNGNANLMDQGGNFAAMFGVGPDGVGGTADDVDVDFGDDTFNPNEGFTGIENTLSRPVFGITS